jgi:hypothetical protein
MLQRAKVTCMRFQNHYVECDVVLMIEDPQSLIRISITNG